MALSATDPRATAAVLNEEHREPSHDEDAGESAPLLSGHSSSARAPPPPPTTRGLSGLAELGLNGSEDDVRGASNGHEDADDTVERVEAHLRSRRGVTAKKRGRVDNLLASVIVGSLVAIFAQSLALVLNTPNFPSTLRFFSFHPPFQSLAILLFGIGILLPQTATANDESTKRRRRRLHELVQSVGFVLVALGSAAMIYNKAEHGAEHFTTWHSRIGVVTLVALVIHVLLGASSTWFASVLGGTDRAKAFWKWHRLTGYVFILPLLLLTAHLAGYHATWVVGSTNKAQRVWIYTVLPILALLGVWTRARWIKVGFFARFAGRR